MVALTPNPSAPSASSVRAKVWASPLDRRLARRYGRIEFLIVRMARSPPVAPHPASRRRSYSRLQAGVGIPGEDLHLPDQLRLQAHGPGLRRESKRRADALLDPFHARALCASGVGRARRSARGALAPRASTSPTKMLRAWSPLAQPRESCRAQQGGWGSVLQHPPPGDAQ
jgi:hypothetical protein